MRPAERTSARKSGKIAPDAPNSSAKGQANLSLRETFVVDENASVNKTMMARAKLKSMGFDTVNDELSASQGNPDANVSWSEELFYQIENRISSDPATPFTMLALLFVFFLGSFGAAWYFLGKMYADYEDNGTGGGANDDGDNNDLFGAGNLMDSLFLTIQVLTSAGFEDNIPDKMGLRYVYFFMIFVGMVIFAILVGFITDAITSTMSALSQGKTKVSERNHTLILGWNEATSRMVVQISFLRRIWQKANESSGYAYLPFLYFLRVPESSPAAANDIVLLNDNKTKEEMHSALLKTMTERGIDPSRTKVGQNIICRVGDPTNVSDLVRAGAHKAASIVTMMTAGDEEEAELSHGKMDNGATMRTILALRHVLFTNNIAKVGGVVGAQINPKLRIALQLTSPSALIDAACFTHKDGREVVFPVDLSVFLNSLLFSCASMPRLATVIMSLLDFEGAAIRRRFIGNLKFGPNNKVGGAIGHTYDELQANFSNATIVGLVDSENTTRQGYGLCPNPKTKLRATDLVVFISKTSTPVPDKTVCKAFENYRNWAVTLRKTLNNSKAKGRVKDQKNVLVCGWRDVWTVDPDRLRDRIMEIADDRLPDSTITFLNGCSNEAFGEVMGDIGLVPVSGPELQVLRERISGAEAKTEFRGEIVAGDDLKETDAKGAQRFSVAMVKNKLLNLTKEEKAKRKAIEGGITPEAHMYYRFTQPWLTGIHVRHIKGDPTHAPVLEPIILKGPPIHTAIVLGTQARMQLPARSRDTRVLTIMLLLRKLTMLRESVPGAKITPMHLVGENHEDMTSKLALTPVAAGDQGSYKADFINTQAIYARIMAQIVAYPLIKEALGDIFSDAEGGANIEISLASAYVPMHVSIEWGVVSEMVALAPGEISHVVGFISESGELSITPHHAMKRAYTQRDKVVIIRRITVKQEVDRHSVPAAPGMRGNPANWPPFGS